MQNFRKESLELMAFKIFSSDTAASTKMKKFW